MSPSGDRPFQLPVRRLVWLPLGIAAVLVALSLAGLIAVSWPKVKGGFGFPARAYAILP